MLLINAELLAEIDTEFEKAVKNNSQIKRLYQKIRDGTATFRDTQDFAITLGKDLSSAFRQKITVEGLPEGKMTFSIASEVVKPELVKGYDYTASYFNEVQKSIYEAKKLRINGAQPDLMENRLDGFVEKLTSDTYDNVGWLLDDPAYIVNYLEAVVDTGIKNNVGTLAQAGIRSRIVREIEGGACPWCVALAGNYDYGEEPDDVYRRHRDCHCKVTYEIPEGFRQDTWSKNWFTDNPNYEWEVQQRKAFEKVVGSKTFKKTTVSSGRYVPRQKLTPEQAKQLEQILLSQ